MRYWTSMLAGSLAVLLIVSRSPAQAPDDDAGESAIGTRLRDFGGFVGMDVRFGDMGGEFAAFAGAEAAVLLKHRVYLGVRGAGLATDNPLVGGQSPGVLAPLEMGYGGIVVGYVIPTVPLVELTVDALVGAGGVRPEGVVGGGDWDAVFVFEPTLGGEVKLARFARLGVGAGYRFVGGADLTGVDDGDLRGMVGTATLRLGWF